ncbi:ATP-binding cassette domain-containing protein [Photobacterium aphoticum]|nr:ATP-binding cassette domain-containing protein [Photobacterium aphoticum]
MIANRHHTSAGSPRQDVMLNGLTLNALTSGYEVNAHDPCSVILPTGQHLALSGPSGCGKSSLLHVLAGLQPANTGTFRWQGRTISEDTLTWWRQQCCYVPQMPIMGGEHLRQALLLPWQLQATTAPMPDDDTLQALLAKVKIVHGLDKPVSTLSGGEKQRVAIVRALLLNRPVWLMDEPTSALDPASRDTVMALLAKQSLTIVSVSHDPHWLASADQQHVMQGQGVDECTASVMGSGSE